MERIVITGIGLTAPNGNSLDEFRQNLLNKKSGVQKFNCRYIGDTLAGICNFDALKYQTKKEIRIGTRAGSIAIYCMGEAIKDSQLNLENYNPKKLGIFLGITEHGNVETENEIYNISQFNYDLKFWTHHHNPRTVANNPAGEASIKFNIHGPHYTIGAACAAGNIGLIQGLQQLQLNEVDIAFAGGISESIHTFGIFAGFKSQGALAHHNNPTKASRPFDKNRNGIVVSEGGAIYILQRLKDALKNNSKIYGEIVAYSINSDATSSVLPNKQRQVECIKQSLKRAMIEPKNIDIVSSHATGTMMGDAQEAQAINEAIGKHSDKTYINNTKSYIGHTMGAAGILELSGNLPAFNDNIVHPTINIDDLDPQCAVKNLVINQAKQLSKVEYILNNSFGMLGINSSLIIKKYSD